MKRIIIIIIFILTTKLQSQEKIDISPLTFDLKGIEFYNNLIFIYGNSPFLIIASTELDRIQQIMASEKGNIVNIIKGDNDFVIFNDIGEIYLLQEGNYLLKKIKSLEDTVTYVIKKSENYFLRTKRRLIKLDNHFKIQNELPMLFNDIWSYNNHYALNSRQSMVVFDEHLIVQADSSILIKFDDDLNPLDTLSLKTLKLCNDCQSSYNLYSDSNYLYVRIFDGIYNGSIYRTKDFKKVEKFIQFSEEFKFRADTNYSGYTDLFKIIEGKKYCINITRVANKKSNFSLFEIINPDSALFISNYDITDLVILSFDISSVFFNDFTIINNKLILISDNKLLFYFNLKNQAEIKKYHLTGINIINDNDPLFINDSTFFYFTQKGIYKTLNKGITFENLKSDSIIYKKERNFNPKILFSDIITKKLNVIGYYESNPSDVIVFSSADFGENWQSKTLDNLSFQSTVHYSNIFSDESHYRIAMNSRGNKQYTQIITFDKDYNVISKTIDSNYAIIYIFSSYLNSYLIVCSNPDNTNDIKFTSNSGRQWNLLKKYNYSTDTVWIDSNNYSIFVHKDYQYSKEIRLNNNKYLFIFSLHKIDSTFTIDVLDLGSNIIKPVYVSKIYNFNLVNYAVESNNRGIYLAINDSLIIMSDPYERATWKYLLFQNNGVISNKKLYRLGNIFLSLYSDNNLSLSLYLMNILDSLSNLNTESNIETLNYLYAYPPYPIPAKDIITTSIYWDNNFLIDNLIIKVYNIYGEVVDDEKSFILDKESEHKGFLRWDCSGQSNGFYIIKIKHGNNSVFLKVIINR